MSYKKGMTAAEYTPWVYSPKTRAALKKGNAESLGLFPPCVFGRAISEYLNDAAVRK
jgi:hypothetical protein